LCKWCEKHSKTGQRWYLDLKNYSQELLEDPERREFIKQQVQDVEFKLRDVQKETRIYRRSRYPIVGRLFRWWLGKEKEKWHFGQVVPLEDAIKILKIAHRTLSPVGVQACICRRLYRAIPAEMCCFKFGIFPFEVYKHEKFPERRVHPLDEGESIELAEKYYEKGYVPQFFTWKTPFIGSLCFCSGYTCNAIYERMVLGIKEILYKSHYIAIVDYDKCIGCGRCIQRCSFGAIHFDRVLGRARIDPFKCFGCGVCRVVCPVDAIALVPREEFPALRRVW